MAITYTSPLQNTKGAQEQGRRLATGFGDITPKNFQLEQALHKKIVDHENDLSEFTPRTARETKAVDFFIRRRIRCDKYVKENNPENPEEPISEEEKARLEAERLQAEFEKRKKALKVEAIAVEPIKGEIKLPPMAGINLANNARTATPFGSEAQSACTEWNSVKFGSVNEGQSANGGYGNSMLNSVRSSANSLFDFASIAEKSPYYNSAKAYKPVNYMSFKSKQNSKNNRQAAANQAFESSDILRQLREKEAAAKKAADKAADKKKADEEAALNKKKFPNGTNAIGLCKTSLPYTHGKWRPSNDNWKPGVNTDGFFTALEHLNKCREENKGKKVVYGEKMYQGTNHKAYKDSSLACALNNLN